MIRDFAPLLLQVLYPSFLQEHIVCRAEFHRLVLLLTVEDLEAPVPEAALDGGGEGGEAGGHVRVAARARHAHAPAGVHRVAEEELKEVVSAVEPGV